MAPWKGPRHRSWASDTNLSLVFAFSVVAGYVIWELFGEAPQGMVTLFGLAGGAILGGLSQDRRRRDSEQDSDVRDAKATASRAEVKADRLTDAAESAHPAETHEAGLPDPELGQRERKEP